MSPPRTLGTVYEAKLFLVMPGANALTREITATILARDGLIDAQDTVPVPSSAAVRRKSAPYRAQAAALRDEVQRLCTQAILLQREAKQLCKPPLRVAGKLVRKCPLTNRWLVTSDECRRLLRQTVRDYLSEKKEL